MKRIVGTWTLNRLLHEIASWALMLAGVFVVFAFNVDCGAVLMSGTRRASRSPAG